VVWREADKPEIDEWAGGPSDVVATGTQVLWLHNRGGYCTAEAEKDYSIRLKDLNTARDVTWKLRGARKLYSLDISPDGQRLVVGGEYDGFQWDRSPDAIWEWPLNLPGSPEKPSNFEVAVPPGQIDWLRFAPDGSLVCVCREMGSPSKKYGDLGYRGDWTGRKFITVWDCPQRYQLS